MHICDITRTLVFPPHNLIASKSVFCYHARMSKKVFPSVPSGPAAPSRRSPSGELAAWLAKYGPVEQAILEARERRLRNRAARRAREARRFGGGKFSSHRIPQRLIII